MNPTRLLAEMGFFSRLNPAMVNPARSRLQESDQHADGGGLARAVGAEEPEDFSGADFEVHVVHRHEIPELLGQLLGLDH